VTDRAVRGWLTEQRASYLYHVDHTAAQRLLAKALDDNPFVLRPAGGVTPAQLRPAAVQAQAAAAFLGDTYSDGTSLVLAVQALTEEVIWGDEERTDDAERAWERLGEHLGFVSTRPEKQYDKGPDNLWVLGAGRHAVIELKTGRTTDTIIKHDLDQLGGSVRWDKQTYPDVTQQIPVMVHPSRTPHRQAITVDGMRGHAAEVGGARRGRTQLGRSPHPRTAALEGPARRRRAVGSAQANRWPDLHHVRPGPCLPERVTGPHTLGLGDRPADRSHRDDDAGPLLPTVLFPTRTRQPGQTPRGFTPSAERDFRAGSDTLG
jgi:hypothetical protein